MWRRRAGRGAGRATVGRCGAGSLARGAEEEPWAAGLAVGGGGCGALAGRAAALTAEVVDDELGDAMRSAERCRSPLGCRHPDFVRRSGGSVRGTITRARLEGPLPLAVVTVLPVSRGSA